MELFEMIANGGLAGYVIVAMGATAVGIAVDRARRLYVQYNIDTPKLYTAIKSSILDGEPQKAIDECGPSQKPVVNAFKTILERYDRDDEAIYQAQEIAISQNAPMYSKQLGHLSMLANVSTLVGLLGTVHGLIMSFAAVSSADPSQKQALLADGISVAMNTTALGLTVAIPTMIVYTLLNARSNQMQEQLIEYTNRIVELLTTGHLQRIQKETLFPENLGKEPVTNEKPPAKELRA